MIVDGIESILIYSVVQSDVSDATNIISKSVDVEVLRKLCVLVIIETEIINKRGHVDYLPIP